MTRTDTSNRTVIYGGGMAGAMLAKKLSPAIPVTLVDPHDYFEVPMAGPRNLVDPEFAERAIVPFAEGLPGVEHVRGSLIALGTDAGVVRASDGREFELAAHVTVLATGAAFANPLMRPLDGGAGERRALYRRYRDRIESAGAILIVGGGPIGVEIAGEISERRPDKGITLLESGPRLLKGTSATAARHAAAVLGRRGVAIVTGERLQQAPDLPADVFSQGGVAVTDSGRELGYDLLIWCTGSRPNTAYMRPALGSALAANGRIRVTPQLRVVGHERLFALGDITDLDENKMAWHITGQLKVAAENVRRVFQAAPAAGAPSAGSLATYRPQTGNPMMAVSLGSREGVLHLPVLGVVRSPWFNRKAKAGHLLVPRYRALLNVP